MIDLRQLRAHLARLNEELRRDYEHAEALLDGLNDELRQFHRVGIVGPVALLGPVVLWRPHAAGGPSDSGQAVQAALALPAGFGAINWDTEELCELEHNPEEAERAAACRVVPFESCEPAVRALLAPHAAELLSRLLASFVIR